MGLSSGPCAPELLNDGHETSEFESGETSLDDWLRKRARANQASGASRTYVAAERNRVVAYYALASGSIAQSMVSGNFRRNMPEPVPVVVLGRLAVDRRWQGRGLGRALFRDAAMRVLHAADAIGVRGIVVHAISEDAKKFYEALGFETSPVNPMTLLVTLRDLRSALQLQ